MYLLHFCASPFDKGCSALSIQSAARVEILACIYSIFAGSVRRFQLEAGGFWSAM